MIITATRDMESAALIRLMTWLSPSYPVGAYTYSHGLEWAVEAGEVRGADDLEAWIADILKHGSGRNDAIVFAHAYRATAAGDTAALLEIVEIASAYAGSSERHLEATAQGEAFLVMTQQAWRCDMVDRLKSASNERVPYPVAVAIAAASHEIGLHHALVAHIHAFSANLISAAVRLVPLGQSDGQRVNASLEAVVEETAIEAIESDLSDLGGCALRSDLAAMLHETQETRLFRS